MWLAQVCVLAFIGYARADCYPGDINYSIIVREVYHSVTSNNIKFNDSSVSRQQLCSILTDHHNNGKNQGQSQTNRDYLGYVTVNQSACTKALTHTQGYKNISGWQQWAGNYSGYWYSTTNGGESDPAECFTPSYSTFYIDQSVRFDSQYRIDHCVTPDSTGATCRHGWNNSGQGVNKVFVYSVFLCSYSISMENT